jgi:hypothetical protein
MAMLATLLAERPASLEAFLSSTKGELSFAATVGKTVLLKKTIALAELFSDNGHQVVVPFLLYGTGCEEVTITVSLKNAQGGPIAPTKRTIPFTCGE